MGQVQKFKQRLEKKAPPKVRKVTAKRSTTKAKRAAPKAKKAKS